MNTTQLVISGSIATDRIFSFDGLFSDKIDTDKLDVLSVSVLMDSYVIVNGGTGANIAFNAAQLGLKPNLLVSIGEDGQAYIDKLQSQGVNTDSANISSTPTATFTVLSDKSGSQVAGFYPGAMSDAESLSLAPWQDTDTLVCVSAHDPAAMKRQVAECSEYNLRLLYDPGQQVTNSPAEDLTEGCKAAEIIIVNEYELGILAKRTNLSEEELKNMPKTFITTKGSKGSVIEGRDHPEPITVAIAKPDKVVDPTGAGDAYRAGLMYGIVNGWDMQKSAQLGAVIGSFNVEISGQTANYTAASVKERFHKAYGSSVEL